MLIGQKNNNLSTQFKMVHMPSFTLGNQIKKLPLSDHLPKLINFFHILEDYLD